MAARWSALVIAGFSTILIAGTAGAAPARVPDDVKGVRDAFCNIGKVPTPPINPRDDLEGAQRQFSDEGILAYHEGEKMTPLDYRYDPMLRSLRIVLNPDGKFGPKGGNSYSDADMLRAYRYYSCKGIVEFMTEYNNQKGFRSEEPVKMKEGYNTDKQINELYHQAYLIEKQAVKDEQARQGLKVTVFYDELSPEERKKLDDQNKTDDDDL
ncbi:hypothetical protein [Nocardia sp. NPDC050175]|uniref:hypothetical protein n=1 Tax=Nocardia sp. NPDC050175 TaxID=3364317 RepID=UPI0037B305F7